MNVSCELCKKGFEAVDCDPNRPALCPECSKAIEVGLAGTAPRKADLPGCPPAKRGMVLSEASYTINGERQDQYGNPEDCFGLIATYWNTYLESKGHTVNAGAADVAMMMVLFKIARQAHSHKHDNIVDLCGYAAILDDMMEKKS